MNNATNFGTLETTTPAGKVSRLCSSHSEQDLPGHRALDPFQSATPIWQQTDEEIAALWIGVNVKAKRDKLTGLYPLPR